MDRTRYLRNREQSLDELVNTRREIGERHYALTRQATAFQEQARNRHTLSGMQLERRNTLHGEQITRATYSRRMLNQPIQPQQPGDHATDDNQSELEETAESKIEFLQYELDTCRTQLRTAQSKTASLEQRLKNTKRHLEFQRNEANDNRLVLEEEKVRLSSQVKALEEITEALTNELQNAEAMAAQETKLREEAEAEIKMQENAAEAWQKQFQESETAKQALKKKLKKNSSSHEELKKAELERIYDEDGFHRKNCKLYKEQTAKLKKVNTELNKIKETMAEMETEFSCRIEEEVALRNDAEMKCGVTESKLKKAEVQFQELQTKNFDMQSKLKQEQQNLAAERGKYKMLELLKNNVESRWKSEKKNLEAERKKYRELEIEKNDLESKLKDATDREGKKPNCFICEDREIDCVYVPCGHTTCSGCADTIYHSTGECPFCKTDISEICTLFFA